MSTGKLVLISLCYLLVELDQKLNPSEPFAGSSPVGESTESKPAGAGDAWKAFGTTKVVWGSRPLLSANHIR